MAVLTKNLPQLKVLISGAGIAGPCLAYWLSQTRLPISTTIMERSPTPRVTGQAIDIRGTAIEVVRKMKLLDDVKSRNTTESGTIFVDSNGKTFAEFAMDSSNMSMTSEYEILRADLAEIFMDATERLKNVKYKYGDFVEALEQRDEKVNVTFAGGSRDSFDLVVAADGATSKIRSMILDESMTKNCYKFWGQYIAYFSIPSLPTDPKTWRWYNTTKGLGMMLRPHRNPDTQGAYVCITTPAHGHYDPVIEDAMKKGPEEQKRMLHGYFDNSGWEAERIMEGMDASKDFYMSRTAQVKLPKWTNGRTVLLGDAAMATMGSGTSLAIEGGYFLAGELSKIESSAGIPKALERYEEVFRGMHKQMEDPPRFFPQVLMPQTAWGLRIRDSLLWTMSKTKLYKAFQGGSEMNFKLPDYDWIDV